MCHSFSYLFSHGGANGVRAAVIVVRAASSVPKPPGHRGRRADFQRISENVLLTSRGRVIHLDLPALSRGGALA